MRWSLADPVHPKGAGWNWGDIRISKIFCIFGLWTVGWRKQLINSLHKWWKIPKCRFFLIKKGRIVLKTFLLYLIITYIRLHKLTHTYIFVWLLFDSCPLIHELKKVQSTSTTVMFPNTLEHLLVALARAQTRKNKSFTFLKFKWTFSYSWCSDFSACTYLHPQYGG